MSVAKVVVVTTLAGSLSIGIALYGQQWIEGRFGSGGQRQAALTTLPDIRLPDVNGREVRSSSWAGKVLILHYWATWCGECEAETALLAQVQTQYGNGRVQVVGVAIDQPAEVKTWLADQPLPYPVLIGGRAAADVSQRLGNRTLGLPFTVMFDAMGRRVFSYTGVVTPEQMRTALGLVLPERSGA